MEVKEEIKKKFKGPLNQMKIKTQHFKIYGMSLNSKGKILTVSGYFIEKNKRDYAKVEALAVPAGLRGAPRSLRDP